MRTFHLSFTVLALLALHVGVGAILGSAANAQGGAPGDETDEPVPPAAESLRRWYTKWNELREFWSDAERDYRKLVRDTVNEAQLSHSQMTAGGLVLLDLGSWGLDRRPKPSDYSGGAARQKVRRRARGALEDLLESPRGQQFTSWMAGEVLAMRTGNPAPRRFLTLDLLARQRTMNGKLAMLTIGRDENDPLRSAVLEVLATWPDEAVDLFLVGLIGKKYDKTAKPHPFNLILTRIRDTDVPLGSRATELLRERLKVTLLSHDWREVSRAIELARGMEPKYGVPLLLDALSAWHRREGNGGGSKRILNDVVRELRRISGRSIGTNPKNWITWWIAVRQGRAELAADSPQSAEPMTSATFFGLRPVTDQVTFVIDLSGSMANEWGTSEHTRYQEAVDQMMRFLQAAGQETRFNVILFNDQPLRSSPHLVRATSHNLSRARDSLLSREPGGGTNLRPAIELALRLDSSGNVDPDRLEADTIIVLCDGETAEGGAWVRPLIDRVHDDARVIFHCVLVGSNGDGTLQTLADMTGGDHIRTGG